MPETKWILTCDGECPEEWWRMANLSSCPQDCPNSHYEKEQVNTVIPEGDDD